MLSRIAKVPLSIPSGVDITIDGSYVKVKGTLGTLEYTFNPNVEITKDGDKITLSSRDGTTATKALSGTTRALLNNMVIGVTSGFEKKLTILGVGYRVALQGDTLNLSLGYSHPIIFKAPEGIKLEVPTPTEIIVRGNDKQLVGQVAALIRAYRVVEPYKGKGVRYFDEEVILKETKKK